jgi:hypothetical protein
MRPQTAQASAKAKLATSPKLSLINGEMAVPIKMPNKPKPSNLHI